MNNSSIELLCLLNFFIVQIAIKILVYSILLCEPDCKQALNLALSFTCAVIV